MARYNSALTSNTITGTATIGSPYSGAFTEFTGTAPYTVTLPTPVAFPGVTQTFYNATSGTVTLSTPAGNFVGTGSTSATTIPIYSGNVISIVSDGSNYVVISEDGSPLIATTASISGDVTINGGSATVSITPSTLTIAPTASSNINNVAIGATTRASGAFTTLASNNAVTFTAGTASSSTTTGTLVVTGGVGVSGTVTAATVNATNLGGTLSTASQPNITSATGLTSVGTLTALTVTGLISAGGIVVGDTTSAITLQSDYSFPLIVQRSGNSGKGAIVMRGSDTIGTAIEHGRSNAASHWGTYQAFLVHDDNTSDALLSIKEKMRINAIGLGIGTTTPSGKLHVYQSAGGSNTLTLDTNFSSGNAYAINPFITGISNGGFSIRDVNNSVERLVIQYSTGNVGIGTTAPGGTLHVTASPVTAAAPSSGWPNYVNPDGDANAKVVAVFDTAGNGSNATAGFGPTVVLRLGSYYDSRAVISPIGAGGASPSDQGTGRGKDLMVKGGTSDNSNGSIGGRLFLNGGAGFNSGAFGARGSEGQVRIQNQGGNTFIGGAVSNTNTPGNNMLYLPFQYNDTGEYAPQRASGMLHIGSFTHRAGNRYLDIRLNQGAGMFMFHIYGYLYNSANINTYIGGYSYTGNSILNLYTQNLGNCSATVYRTTTNNILCVKIDRGGNGYSEGKVNVFYHAWSQGEMEGMAVTSYAQNDSASNYYTS